jgi:RND family efflux transporter MFP subunit
MRIACGLLLLAAPVMAAEPQDFECLIEPKVTVALSTPVEGIIEKVHVDRGDLVKKGQVVVELESDVERAVVERARVSLEFAERDLARNEELSRTNVISDQDLDEAQSGEEVARVDLQRARAALAQRTIRSPVNGVVIKRHHSPGEYADTRPILELAEVDPLYVEVFAPVSALGSIRPGMTAQVVPEGPLGGSHEATVTVVDSVVDAASGTFGVRLELPNPDHAIPAGLNCRVRLGDVPEEKPAADTGAAPLPAVEAAAAEEEPEPSTELPPVEVDVELIGPPAPEAVEPEPIETRTPPAVGAAPARVPETEGRVARATFTTGVEQREPVDSIESLTNDHSRVLFFTEFRGMGGRTLTHRWEFEGGVVAEVPFEVRGRRWRVYSFKQLRPDQTGDWTVSVVDEAGNRIERKAFRYVAAGEGTPASAEDPTLP